MKFVSGVQTQHGTFQIPGAPGDSSMGEGGGVCERGEDRCGEEGVKKNETKRQTNVETANHKRMI